MMPTYILDEARAVRLPPGPVTVQVHFDGSTGGEVEVHAINDGKEVRSLRPRPGLLVIPDAPDGTVLRVVPPPPQRTFASSAAVTLAVSTARPSDPDPPQAIINRVDVAGLSERDLASLSSGSDGVVVTRLGSSEQLDQSLLPELAERARVTARELLGVGRVPTTSSVTLVVAIDPSASMIPFIRRGAFRALLDVLAGISRVVSPGQRVRCLLLQSPPHVLEEVDAADLAEAVAARAATAPVTLGFSASEPALLDAAAQRSTVAYLLTDTIPADLRDPGDALASTRPPHVVVLGARSAVLDGWTEASPLSVTVAPVDDREDDGPHLLVDRPGELRDLVRSLLSACFEEGSPLAEKVSR